MRCAWLTIKQLAAEEKNVGALPGMVAVLHTWGSDLKYHPHVHTLVTFGGLKDGQWKWPKRKKWIVKFRPMRKRFRALMLAGLKKLMADGEVIYHRSYEDIERDLMKIEWTVHSTLPVMNTGTIETYSRPVTNIQCV